MKSRRGFTVISLIGLVLLISILTIVAIIITNKNKLEDVVVGQKLVKIGGKKCNVRINQVEN